MVSFPKSSSSNTTNTSTPKSKSSTTDSMNFKDVKEGTKLGLKINRMKNGNEKNESLTKEEMQTGTRVGLKANTINAKHNPNASAESKKIDQYNTKYSNYQNNRNNTNSNNSNNNSNNKNTSSSAKSSFANNKSMFDKKPITTGSGSGNYGASKKSYIKPPASSAMPNRPRSLYEAEEKSKISSNSYGKQSSYSRPTSGNYEEDNGGYQNNSKASYFKNYNYDDDDDDDDDNDNKYNNSNKYNNNNNNNNNYTNNHNNNRNKGYQPASKAKPSYGYSYQEPEHKPEIPEPFMWSSLDCVEVVHEFIAEEAGDLDIHPGDSINLISKSPDGSLWWTGRNAQTLKVGKFPANYTSAIF